jgi:nitrate reductase NapE component
MNTLITNIKNSVSLKKADTTQQKIENVAFCIIAIAVIVAVSVALVIGGYELLTGNFHPHNFDN